MFITSALGSDWRRQCLLAFAVLLAACGAPEQRDSDASVSSQGPDNRRGELLSLACQACHSLTEGGSNQVGPNLYGVFGRTAGQVPGFKYSPPLRESGIVWSPAELDQWLADPADYLPGTTMAFTGYQSASDRAALIDYLVSVTGR